MTVHYHVLLMLGFSAGAGSCSARWDRTAASMWLMAPQSLCMPMGRAFPQLPEATGWMDAPLNHEDERARGGVPHLALLLLCCALSFTGIVRRIRWPCSQNCIYREWLSIVAAKHTAKTSPVPSSTRRSPTSSCGAFAGVLRCWGQLQVWGHVHYSASKHTLRLKSSLCYVKGIDLSFIVMAKPNVSF